MGLGQHGRKGEKGYMGMPGIPGQPHDGHIDGPTTIIGPKGQKGSLGSKVCRGHSLLILLLLPVPVGFTELPQLGLCIVITQHTQIIESMLV